MDSYFIIDGVGIIPKGTTVIAVDAYLFYWNRNINAFDSCSKLKSIVLPNHVTYLNEAICARCASLTDVYFGKHIKDIKAWAFENRISLKHIFVPQGQVEHIKDMPSEDLRELVVEQLKEVVEPPMFLDWWVSVYRSID